jgi:small subunit ribosomal protein S2
LAAFVGINKLPDALVIVDPRHEEIAAAEAKKLNIPIVALLNTDCDSRGMHTRSLQTMHQ